MPSRSTLRRSLPLLAIMQVSLSACGTVSNVVGAIMGKPPEAKAAQPPAAPPRVAVVPARVIDVTIAGDAAMNVDAQGLASPVLLRVYLLKGTTTFQGADFFSLFERDQATLGGDLLAREEMHLRPGQSLSFSRELTADARAIAVFAAFRDLERSRWRAFEALPPPPQATTSPPPKPIAVPIGIRVGARQVALGPAT